MKTKKKMPFAPMMPKGGKPMTMGDAYAMPMMPKKNAKKKGK